MKIKLKAKDNFKILTTKEALNLQPNTLVKVLNYKDREGMFTGDILRKVDPSTYFPKTARQRTDVEFVTYVPNRENRNNASAIDSCWITDEIKDVKLLLIDQDESL